MPAIALALLEHDPDAIVLSEFRRTTGGQIRAVLADHGWTNQVCTAPSGSCNGMLLASREPLHPEPISMSGPESARRCVLAHLPEQDLTIAGVHAPHSGAGPGRRQFWEALLRLAAHLRNRRAVIIGDFNTGRRRLDSTGRGPSLARVLDDLSGLGYVDAYRRIHRNRREYSWFSHTGSGYRIDHAYVSAPLADDLGGVRYSHVERGAGLSDHSLLVLETLAHSNAARCSDGRAMGRPTTPSGGDGSRCRVEISKKTA